MRRAAIVAVVALSACGKAEVGFPEGRHMSERFESVRREGGPTRAEDRHSPAVLVAAEVIEIGRAQAEGLGSLLQYRDAHVEVRTSLPWPANGLVLVAVTRGEEAAVSRRLARLEAAARRRTQATIREGADGEIEILSQGSGVREIGLWTGAGDEGAVRRERHEIVGTGLRVRALRVVGQEIELEIIPLMRVWESERVVELEWPELAARLVVPAGQSVLLMAGGESAHSAGRALLSRPEGSDEIQALVWIRFDRPD